MTARSSCLAGIIVVVAACGTTACAKKRIACFSATSADTSAQARALFDARHCQGGGVTWAPILEALVRRHGNVVPVDEPTAGWTGSLFTLDGKTRFSIDDEADAAQLCSDDAQLVAAIRREHAALNRDVAELRRVMAQASAAEMECLEADGTVPPMPKMNPIPQAPPEQTAATRSRLEQLARTIAAEPAWCFPPDDPERRKGVLRFAADGTATLGGSDGKIVARGTWRLPRAETGDDRVEVVMPGAGGMLLHLGVGPSGRLGETAIGAKKTTRRELVAGDACARTR